MFRWYPIVLVVAIVVIVGVCGSALAQTGEEMEAAYQDFMEVLNAHDLDLWLSSSWVDDPVFDAVPLPAPLDGKEAIAGYIGGVLQGFPDFHMSSPHILTSGNILVSEPIYTGTHQGEFMGVPATGNSVQIWGLEILEFEGDRIKRETQYWDVASMMIQIGAMPASDPPVLEPSFELPAPEPTALAPLEADAELIARWNPHNLAHWMKMLHLEVVFKYNTVGMLPLNREQTAALNELFALSNSTLHGETVRQIDMGDGWIVTESVWPGVQDGPYFGIPATGLPVEVRAASVGHYDADGLVTEFNFYFDNLGVLVQIGAVPAPGTTSVQASTWGQIKATFQE